MGEKFGIDASLRPTLEEWVSAGDRVAVYQNVAMDSSQCGHLKFLRVGPGATLKEAPKRMPDVGGEINWRYRLQGELSTPADLEEVVWNEDAPTKKPE